ncbi:MAG: antibiotic biosynthesis monooxygenase [Candidatus Hydrogenedentes bacterium]|nr:antibiotic biosynthesis monooxygenase [Candidatus Hydrogenedentota bacterium]
MLEVLVYVHVKPGCAEAFRAASLENARKSRQEPGVYRFDVLQETEAPERFVLVEGYRTPEAAAAHKETAHYAKWRDTVADMMAEPRRGVKHLPCGE